MIRVVAPRAGRARGGAGDRARRRSADAPRVLAPPLDPALAAVLARRGPRPSTSTAVPDGRRRSRRPTPRPTGSPGALPGAETVPGREALRARAIGAEVAALAEVGLRLRRECPWDREQTAETIVAAHDRGGVRGGRRGRPRRRRAWPTSSATCCSSRCSSPSSWRRRAAPTSAAVARGQADKLIRAPPPRLRRRERRDGRPASWTSGSGASARSAPTRGCSTTSPRACRRWRSRRRPRSGPRRPASTTPTRRRRWPSSTRRRPSCAPIPAPGSSATCSSPPSPWPAPSGADPELALRASAQRFRARVEGAARLAGAAGEDFEGLPLGGADALVRGRPRRRGRPPVGASPRHPLGAPPSAVDLGHRGSSQCWPPRRHHPPTPKGSTRAHVQAPGPDHRRRLHGRGERRDGLDDVPVDRRHQRLHRRAHRAGRLHRAGPQARRGVHPGLGVRARGRGPGSRSTG